MSSATSSPTPTPSPASRSATRRRRTAAESPEPSVRVLAAIPPGRYLRPTVKTHNIGVLGGDGIGPEVTAEAVKALEAAAAKFGFGLNLVDYPFGAEHALKTRELIPDRAFAEMKTLDAILLGAIGDPRFETGYLEFGIVGRLRFDLDLFVNLRPIKLYAEHLCPLKGKKVEDLQMVV